MHSRFLSQFEKSVKKFTAVLVFSFAVLLCMHHIHRSKIFERMGFDFLFFRTHTLSKSELSFFSPQKEKGLEQCLALLNQCHVDQNKPFLEGILPQCPNDFCLKWRSVDECMYALYSKGVPLRFRIRVRTALLKIMKDKMLSRSLSGKEVRIHYTYWHGEKHVTALELPVNFIVTKKIHIKENDSYVETIKDKVVPFILRTQGVVSTTLMADLRKKRVPYSALQVTASILESNKTSLRQYCAKGTQFFLLYKGIKNARTGETQCTHILFLKLKQASKQLSLYPYAFKNDKPCVFTEDGRVISTQGESNVGFIRPLSGGRLSSKFGHRKHPMFGYHHHHKGIDLAAPLGTPVLASASGIVEKVGWVRGYGKFIRIRHSKLYHTAYGHLSRYAKNLQPGKRVEQGQVIGFVGSTGNATGNHLHFEMIKNGAQVNPFTIQTSHRPIERMGRAQYRRFRSYIHHLNEVYNTLKNNYATPQK